MSQSLNTRKILTPAVSAGQISPDAAAWLQARGVDAGQSQAIPGDASGRHYWRLPDQRLFMDAPPPEDILPFLRVQQRWQSAGLPVPKILAAQLQPGFVLIEDLGTTDLKAILDTGTETEFWMQQALDLIVALQSAGRKDDARPRLPFFSRQRLGEELTLFYDWYLLRHLGVTPDEEAQQNLQKLFALLQDNALNQPQVWVHRDFHARNLMLQTDPRRLVMIDFQDAVTGPWTYDLASLLWDRYWDWGSARRHQWILDFQGRLSKTGRAVLPQESFVRSVEWMALQRNIKILGIFCRLAYRDGKSGYLDLLPQFRKYVLDALASDAQLQIFFPQFSVWLAL
ncbi:phosphotransferase [Acidithiobacillus thiooxidans]|jgi:aminoglycoside/choline kinase family phosphotransferase|uniref:aminoglycoside phosphotransferase family protein n=1 Tax=Acidithiobacillus TaxID=119977 RepID=UPI00030A0F23|nr:phosphotransferase [Acidithiobacillus thiooxidans]MBU2810233.1 phosphotransferase [Acidithiobacillus thiooxidans]